jgi:hypothetical protein
MVAAPSGATPPTQPVGSGSSSIGTKVLQAVLPEHDGPTAVVPVEMDHVSEYPRRATSKGNSGASERILSVPAPCHCGHTRRRCEEPTGSARFTTSLPSRRQWHVSAVQVDTSAGRLAPLSGCREAPYTHRMPRERSAQSGGRSRKSTTATSASDRHGSRDRAIRPS